MPPRLLSLQLILEPLSNCISSLAFLSLFLPGSGLQSEPLGEVIDFLRQFPVLGFPRLVVRLDLCLELVQRLIGRRRILEEGPVITQKEMIEQLVSDVKVLMLDMSLLTSKCFANEWKGNGYVHRWRGSPGRKSCSLRLRCGQQKC